MSVFVSVHNPGTPIRHWRKASASHQIQMVEKLQRRLSTIKSNVWFFIKQPAKSKSFFLDAEISVMMKIEPFNTGNDQHGIGNPKI